MTDATLVPSPSCDMPPKAFFRVSPLRKRRFKTVLDAGDVFAEVDNKLSEVAVAQVPADGDLPARVEVRVAHPFKLGTIREVLCCDVLPRGLRTARLEREVLDLEGEVRRTEVVDFRSGVLPLPDEVYPEVMLPFVLRWFPFDAPPRCVYAWMNDRFVAKVYWEQVRRTKVDLPTLGRRDAVEFIMFPDFGDWIPLGSVLTKLSKPFVPKYRVWYEPNPPFSVLRFEGPYGPPGSIEITLELERVEH